jgi:hypothetical protein
MLKERAKAKEKYCVGREQVDKGTDLNKNERLDFSAALCRASEKGHK